MEFIIKPEDSGINIKDFLRREINPSRKLLNLTKNKPDGILINGERMTVRYILNPGDILHFNYDNPEEPDIIKNESLLELIEIVYEDEYILGVNKPPDMPSHPSFNHLDDTLANAVVAYYYQKTEKNEKNQNKIFRPVNRLDKDTSGLVLIAKDKLISAKLNALIKRGEIKKVYHAAALCDFNQLNTQKIQEIHERLLKINGSFEYNPATRTGRITAPIRREHDSIIKRTCAADGNFSVTEFKFVKTITSIESNKSHESNEPNESNGEISIFEVYPITGRTHQIRVHFHLIGAALLGDDLYYHNLDLTLSLREQYNIKRHALHAASLEFIHPMQNSNIKIECGLPKDMREIIKNI
jgi:23S rRNA pseudouridine1911/1915/1917 synthase